MERVEKFLTRGLINSFGKGRIVISNRFGFSIKIGRYYDPNEGSYHDEWTDGRLGGGQEFVDAGGKKFTRLYAGGTLETEKLEALGITEKDVISFLKTQITENPGKTRLFENFDSEGQIGWAYQYRVLDRQKDLNLTLGKETIYYNGVIVFSHGFLLSPIEQ